MATATSTPGSSATPVRHALSLWHQSPTLPLLETSPSSANVLIFIPGLTDTLGTVPYLDELAANIAELDFSLVQPQLSSSLGGFGLSSLEADAQELELVIKFLQEQRKSRDRQGAPAGLGKVVLMGHSTGCQDIAHFFALADRRRSQTVHGAVLQAPVSDREDFEWGAQTDAGRKSRLEEATRLVEQGKGATLLPRDVLPPQPLSKEKEAGGRTPEVNGQAFEEPAMTAYRYWSLNAKGGHDDYFSSDLPDDRVRAIWANIVGSPSEGPRRRVLALLGEKDEFYPPSVTPQALAQKWNAIAGNDGAFNALVVQGANHKVDEPVAKTNLVRAVVDLLRHVVAENAEQGGGNSIAAESHSDASSAAPATAASGPAPSFDEIVELISTGQADSIPGIRSIPLKINEASPSQATMQRPPKPWESK